MPFEHYCHCGKWGSFGIAGKWYCREHRGATPAGDFQAPPPRSERPADLFGHTEIVRGIPDGVTRCFEHFVDEARKIMTQYSADAILHRIRWFEHIDRGNRAFKCPDNWAQRLGRWYVSLHPEAESFFIFKKSRFDDRGWDWDPKDDK